MPAYSTPGVYVTESPFTALTPSISGVSAAAFFGEAERGPTTPTLVTDWATYKLWFGDLKDQYDLGYAVFHYFANGGRAAYVTRVVDAASTAATRSVFPFYPSGVGQASASLFTLTATSKGTWGNSLTVQTTAGNVPATSSVKPTFNLTVYLNGVEVERWLELSPDVNSSRYMVTVVNKYSAYIRLSAPTSASAGVNWAYYTAQALSLSGGTQSTVLDTDFTTSFDGLDTVEGSLILNAVGKTSTTVVQGLVTKAATRGDSFVIIDPDKTDITYSDIQTTVSSYAGLSSSSYAAVYSSMLEMVDPAKSGPGAIRTTHPGGALAGLYVRTEVEKTVAKAPAGFSADIRGALGTTIKLTDAQIGALYDGTPAVNSFKEVAGAGVVAWGTRTLNKVNPDKFINVRRTLNYLKYALKDLTRFAVFESNDERLWTELNVVVSGFLADFWRAGGLKGARASDAFYVVCDSTINTPVSIDNGEVRINVGVALQYPAEFIVINISQWTGGSNAVESL